MTPPRLVVDKNKAARRRRRLGIGDWITVAWCVAIYVWVVARIIGMF